MNESLLRMPRNPQVNFLLHNIQVDVTDILILIIFTKSSHRRFAIFQIWSFLSRDDYMEIIKAYEGEVANYNKREDD